MAGFKSIRIAIVYGTVVGALAGCINAFQDFSGTWFWLYAWSDRAAFAWRILALHLSMGALLGAAIALGSAVLLQAGRALVRRHYSSNATQLEHRYWPIPLLVWIVPLAIVLGVLLFSGGSMSRLPLRGLWSALSSVVLIALAIAALKASRCIILWAHQGAKRRAWLTAVSILVFQGALTKINQYVFPNLYGYLHHTLSLLTWLVAGLGIWCVLGHQHVKRHMDELRPWHGVALAILALFVFAGFAFTLDRNQNVRAALLDSRAASSRSLMKALRPVLVNPNVGAAYAKAARRAALLRRRPAKKGTRTQPLKVLPAAHILLITVDALRPDRLGAYGYKRRTSPSLDALANTSWVFERAYTQAPHSSFAISSVMASEYLYQVADLNHPMPEATLASTLNDAGYYTAAFYTLGIFHTQGQRLQFYQDNAFGFKLHDHETREADDLTHRVMEEIDRIVDAGEPPSLMWAHYFDAHEPYHATTFGSSDSSRYDSEILEVDTAIAKLIAHARRRFSREVLIVITADHGEEFRDHGGVYHGSTLYDEQVRIPLIIHVPHTHPCRVPGPVELIDLTPTLLSLVGLNSARSMRGIDLRGFAQDPNETADTSRPVFSAVSYQHMVVQWPYKLIADLRYNTHELFDLSRDPKERRNLADSAPEKLTELRGEIHAWLDTVSQPPGHHGPSNPYELALARGHLGNREAIETLIQMLHTSTTPSSQRREAAELLGNLADKRAIPALSQTLTDPDPNVAAESAIALGRLYQPQAKTKLIRLLSSEDPKLRARAAVSLGRLREPAAIPALIEGLETSVSEADRIETIRWLGRLRAQQAVEPLLEVLEDLQLRSYVAIALGQIGNRRALEPLLERLETESSTSIRDNLVRALGLLRAPEALGPLLHTATREPSLKYATESLVRLNAVPKGLIGGVDLDKPSLATPPFAHCHNSPFYSDWNYSQRTFCETNEAQFSLKLPLPTTAFTKATSLTLVIRARRLDDNLPLTLTLRLGSQALKPVSIDKSWKEYHWRVPSSEFTPGSHTLTVQITPATARIGLDHALLLPH